MICILFQFWCAMDGNEMRTSTFSCRAIILLGSEMHHSFLIHHILTRDSKSTRILTVNNTKLQISSATIDICKR